MKNEIKEIRIKVDVADSYKRFEAILRDGELQQIDKLRDRPERQEIFAYLEFLKEILEEMN